ncbi:MAG: hypothetical protein ABJB47_04595 [Actinomycetota bacterium]
MPITRHLRFGRILRACRGGFPAGALVLGAVLATSLPAVTPASAAAPKLLCHRYQHVPVQAVRAGQARRAGQQGSYMVRNDFWGTKAMCMSNSGKQPNFTVVKAGKNTLNGAVMAFPYIFTGCSWGICTPHSGLPAQASTLKDPRSSWDITATAGGIWDASYDLWFSRHRITNGQATGAELMIWLNSSNIPPFSKKYVFTISGAKWYFVTWKTPVRDGMSWRYLQFRRVHPTSSVKNLDLGAFIRKAENMKLGKTLHHYIKTQWWLMNVEAGFELTRGGAGLATNSFSAHL